MDGATDQHEASAAWIDHNAWLAAMRGELALVVMTRQAQAILAQERDEGGEG